MARTPSLKTQQMQVGGMDCASCALKIESSLEKLAGVTEVAVNAATGRLTVSYDPQQVSQADIQKRVTSLGYTVASEKPASMQTLTAVVSGMDCPSCAGKISTALEKLAGVGEATVNLNNSKLTVSYNPQQVDETTIRDRVINLGYTLSAPSPNAHNYQSNGHDHAGHSHDHGYDRDHDHGHDHSHSHGNSEFSLKRELPSVLIVVVLFAIGLIFEERLHNTPYSVAEYAVFIPAYLMSGWSVLKTAGRNILRGQLFDENFLMTVATLGAIAIHKLPEAVAVMLFYKVGELFQEAAVNRSRRSIKSLLEIRPDSANLKTETGIQAVSPEQVQIGALILVKPGEKVPLDGEIIEGQSQVDTSALTGRICAAIGQSR